LNVTFYQQDNKMLYVLKLDRATLLAALEGRLASSECNPTRNQVSTSCQGLSLGNANIMSRFWVESLGTINIPVPTTVSI